MRLRHSSSLAFIYACLHAGSSIPQSSLICNCTVCLCINVTAWYHFRWCFWVHPQEARGRWHWFLGINGNNYVCLEYQNAICMYGLQCLYVWHLSAGAWDGMHWCQHSGCPLQMFQKQQARKIEMIMHRTLPVEQQKPSCSKHPCLFSLYRVWMLLMNWPRSLDGQARKGWGSIFVYICVPSVLFNHAQ